MTSTDSSLATQLRSLALGVAATEARAEKQQIMLDDTMDLHNELTDWVCNTEHSEAADEITAILEKYTKKDVQLSIPRVVVPLALSRRAVQ